MTDREAVKQLGDQIGYGNMMYLASELWKELMIATGDPTTAGFVPAFPCYVRKDNATPTKPDVCGDCGYWQKRYQYNPDAADGSVPGDCYILQVPHPRHKHDPACIQKKSIE
jgi:hypothetical protein